jgi:hypothetical protein
MIIIGEAPLCHASLAITAGRVQRAQQDEIHPPLDAHFYLRYSEPEPQ